MHPNFSSLHKTLTLLAVFVITGAFLLHPHSANAGLILNHPNYWELTNGLVGYWSFDGQDMNATPALDKSGHGNNGALTQTVVSVRGKLGQALELDTGSSVDLGHDASLDNSDNIFALSMWLKRKVPGTFANEFSISKEDGGFSQGFTFGLSENPCSVGQFKLTKFGAAGGDICIGSVPADTDWHHYVALRRAYPTRRLSRSHLPQILKSFLQSMGRSPVSALPFLPESGDQF